MPEWFAKFNPPTIADGKVFRPAFGQVQVPIGPDGKDTGDAPTNMGPGKVVVYGFPNAAHDNPLRHESRSRREGGDPQPLFNMDEKWQRFGGSGPLVRATTDEIELADARRGRRRDYQGWVSSRPGQASVRPEGVVGTCHRPSKQSTTVYVSVFWSETTGAQTVLGEIREEYLRLGAHKSSLGYPVSDEQRTTDGKGRVSYFELGEIRWYPESGATTYLNG